MDNIFILKSLLDIAKANKSKVYCCFIDFKPAFDRVWRNGLWYKLNEYKIYEKCLTIIQSMYNIIKSKVVTSKDATVYTPCLAGVRQGEKLSPLLFSIFLNDLKRFVLSNRVNGMEPELNSEPIYIYLKLLILLYTDGIVLFNNSE